MKNAFLVTLASVMLGAFSPLRADKPAAPAPWVATAERGHFMFKMIPSPEAGSQATGVAYEVDRSGEMKELWRMEGGYAPEGYLSGDGKTVACLGPWATDHKNHTDVAVTFYHEGRLVKQHQVRELLKDASKVTKSVSHYQWRPEVQTEPTGFMGYYGEGAFHLVMIDQTVHHFDAATGELLTTGSDPGAGKAATAAPSKSAPSPAPPWPPEWDAAFEAVVHALETRRINDVMVPGWSGVWRPRHPLKQPCEIVGWFPADESGRIQTALTPKEILQALESTLAHPFVAKRIQAGWTNGLRLFLQGDALQNNRDVLATCLSHVRPGSAAADENEDLRHWARLLLLGPTNVRNWPEIFLNTRDQSLIVVVPFIEMSTYYFESYMLGPDGEPPKIKGAAQVDGPETKGLEMWRTAPFKADYEARFHLGKIGAQNQYSDRAWRATLQPRQPLPVECVAQVEFATTKDGKFAGEQAAAAEVEEAMRMAVRHPAVLKAMQEEAAELAEYKAQKAEREKEWLDAKAAQQAEDAKNAAPPLTLRVKNQWLHHDKKDLLEWLEKLKPGVDLGPEMRQWACFEIPRPELVARAVPVYLNTQTGEVIKREPETWTPSLWDAQGVRVKTD